MPVSSSTEATSRSRPSSENCRLDRFTAMFRRGSPIFCQAMFCAQAVLSTHLPIDTIKIDGSLIHDLSNHAENRGIAEAIIAMGRNLSMTVVAECVETKAEADFLREPACDEFQGFYFSKAVTAAKFAELLEAQTTAVTEA